ncbi:MAG: hypothetical protein A2289_09465 [Deltaproteobacteria bacterium RIFOXYA12_FULL_58_15]|nr:MAG: hypothetical protein A2289_09465 [Deltaproteobacteria bacterium RIFOXYA12_FULL_58_15]OGR14713.1 MAG: hypothetical protein A2341_05005 [Deltaproteobacteria bacterium RIFOXYB12_FULL_58_9]
MALGVAALAMMISISAATDNAAVAAPKETASDGATTSAAEATPMSGPESSKEPTVFADVDLYVVYNPKGIALRTALNRRYTYHRDVNPLFDKAHLQATVGADINPAYGRYLVAVQWQPLQILRLRAEYAFMYFHGYAGLLTFDSIHDDWSEPVRLHFDGEEITGAHNIRLIPEVRMKIGPVVFQNTTEANHYRVLSDAPIVFENWYGLPMESVDWLLVNRAILGTELTLRDDDKLIVGGFYDVREVLGTKVDNHRLGAVAMWMPTELLGMTRVYGLLIVGVHLSHRYISGTPFLMAGFGGSIDILPPVVSMGSQ